MQSDLERARMARPNTSDADLVVGLAEQTLDELGLTPAINHEIVASYRGVIRIDTADIDWSGHIAQTPAGLVVTVNAGHPPSRQRFTTLHEVMHTFLPGFSMQTQYRCHTGAADANAHSDSDMETLCDIGAAELLLPRAPFLDDLAGRTKTLDLLKDLAARYEASLDATARRVVTLNNEPTLFIAFEVSCKPTRPYDEPALRVRYLYSDRRWPYIPKYKSVSDNSVFMRALSGEVINEVASLGDITTTSIENAYVSAMYSPYHDNDGDHHMRVLALITRPARAGECRG